MLRNVAGQRVVLVARNAADGSAASGDAPNMSVAVAGDGGPAVSATNAPAEIIGAPGLYWLELSQAETDANEIAVLALSATPGVLIDPVFVSTRIDAASLAGEVDVSAASRSAIAGAVKAEPTSGAAAGTIGGGIATAEAAAGTLSTGATDTIVERVWSRDISGAAPGGASAQSQLRDARIAAEAAESGVSALNDPTAAEVATAVEASQVGTDAAAARAAAEANGTTLAGLAVPTAGEVADAVWDEPAGEHAAAGSTGGTLSAAAADAGAAESSATAAAAAIAALNDLSAADVAAALEGAAVEAGVTVQQALRLIVAAAAGRTSGAGTSSFAIRDLADTRDRIQATVDAVGNRTAVVTDVG